MRSRLRRVSAVVVFCAANVIFGVALVAHPIPASAVVIDGREVIASPQPSKLKVHVCPDSAPLMRGWVNAERGLVDSRRTLGWQALAGSNEPQQLQFQSVKYLKHGQYWHVQCNYGDTAGIALMYDRYVLPNCKITSSNTVTCP
jgi:hypothetical protein